MGDEYYNIDKSLYTYRVLYNGNGKVLDRENLDDALELAERKLRGDDLEAGYIYAPYIPITFSNFYVDDNGNSHAL